MKVLKLGQSLVSMPRGGGWTPTDESSLEAWYQNAVGITLNGSDVSQWADSSSNNNHMTQSTASQQPAYSAGVLTFAAASKDNLEATSQMSFSGAFTLGFKFNPTATNTIILGDNTTGGEFIKYSTTSRIVVKIDGSTKNLNLDSGTFGDDYVVISRDSSNLLTLYKNGTAQSGTQTLAGTADIDAIGVRATDLNPYDGTIEEIQIYSSESAALTANINARLSGI